MERSDIHKNIANNYFYLLKNIEPDSKLELIAKLSESMKSTVHNKENLMKLFSGEFIPEKSADELIKEINDSRNFNRKTEEF